MVRDTSMESYSRLQEAGTLETQKERIYREIREKTEATDKELSVWTGMNINAVTKARNTLMTEGFIVDCGKRECSITGNLVHSWAVAGSSNNPVTLDEAPVDPYATHTGLCVVCGRPIERNQPAIKCDFCLYEEGRA